jgi:hypothetical protein
VGDYLGVRSCDRYLRTGIPETARRGGTSLSLSLSLCRARARRPRDIYYAAIGESPRERNGDADDGVPAPDAYRRIARGEFLRGTRVKTCGRIAYAVQGNVGSDEEEGGKDEVERRTDRERETRRGGLAGR